MTIKINVEYKIKVIDNKTGKVVKTLKGKSKTFNLNFARLLGLLFQRGDIGASVSITDTGGVGRTFSNNTYYNPLNVATAAGNKLRFHIGSSNTPFDRAHYEMQALISTFDYSTWSLTDDGTKVKVDISGSWLNPGPSVTVREIGFDVVFSDSGYNNRRVLLARDVIPDTVVDAGRTIAVAYSITIPF